LYEFGAFCLDPAEHTLLRDGQPIPLRPKVYDLLVVLVENRGHLVDKEQLMSSVWAEEFVEEGNINKNISMLRQALGESGGGTKFIETVPKRGYRFVAEVREVNNNQQAELLTQAAARPTHEHQPPRENHEQSLPLPPPMQVQVKRFNKHWIAFGRSAFTGASSNCLCGLNTSAKPLGDSSRSIDRCLAVSKSFG
jgi:DNA-binding winged helix-turn-helix (wHTH) protein